MDSPDAVDIGLAQMLAFVVNQSSDVMLDVFFSNLYVKQHLQLASFLLSIFFTVDADIGSA